MSFRLILVPHLTFSGGELDQQGPHGVEGDQGNPRLDGKMPGVPREPSMA